MPDSQACSKRLRRAVDETPATRVDCSGCLSSVLFCATIYRPQNLAADVLPHTTRSWQAVGNDFRQQYAGREEIRNFRFFIFTASKSP